MFLKFIVVLLTFVFTTHTCSGQCVINQLTVQQNFKIDKYVGKWYEILWRPPRNTPKTSIVTDYNTILTKNSGDSNITITNNFRKQNYNNPCQTSTGNLVTNVQQPAKLNIIFYDLSLGYVRNIEVTIGVRLKFPVFRRENRAVPLLRIGVVRQIGIPLPLLRLHMGYWVISTDYTGYSIVYSCGNILPNGTCNPDTMSAAVWSRKGSSLTPRQKQTATTLLRSYCIDINSMIATDHNHPCPSSSTRINPHLLSVAFVVVAVKHIFQ